MASIKCGRCSGYHASVVDVRACYNGEYAEDTGATVATIARQNPATSRQREYAQSLMDRYGFAFRSHHNFDTISKSQASDLIGALKARDFASASVAIFLVAVEPTESKQETSKPRAGRFDTETLEDGFYSHDGAVYKVIRAVHGSGRKYAKRLDLYTGEWETARGVVAQLRPSMKLTLEQALETAKRSGLNPQSALYGRCFVCGRTLTDETSIEEGIGPICKEKF